MTIDTSARTVYFHWGLRVAALSLLACLSCGSDPAEPPASPDIVEGKCEIDGKPPEFVVGLPCKADFEALASAPINASLPGARSVKVVLDQADADHLYFQNSVQYQIHYDFVSEHLSGGALPHVPALSSFNGTEYYTPNRRFILGAVTHYEGPDVWAFELAPYDTASVEMIEKVYRAAREATYFGPKLAFHPTSEALERQAAKVASDVRVVTTDELYSQIDYQPLTLATAVGRLHFTTAAALADEYLGYEDIVVLDEAPNDISVVTGLITQGFQTPLSHVNVLSQNRGTPNMGLRNALTNPELLALDGRWVELTVGSSSWSVREATSEEAAAYQAAHRPEPIELSPFDLTATELLDIEDVTPEPAGVSLREAIKTAVRAYGGKAAHYSILARTEGVPVPKAFAIPVFYYDQFMEQNGLYDRLDALLKDPKFLDDPATRDGELAALRDTMMTSPVDDSFQAALKQKLKRDFPGQTMRFRSSTNSEDLDGFPCAGCYESHTGDPANWDDVLDAIRETWSSIWLFRTFEERSYYGIDHKRVGMALLVHHSFPAEEANGVAATNNPFDSSGLETAFYVNAQWGGDAEVVHPPAGVTSDQFLYFFGNPNQPITFISHSNLIPEGETVLTPGQTHELGLALSAIHERFSAAYGPRAGHNGWYALEVDFKFDDFESDDGKPKLYVKQARPHPGRGE